MNSRGLQTSKTRQWVSPAFDDFQSDVTGPETKLPKVPKPKPPKAAHDGAERQGTLPQLLGRKRSRPRHGGGGGGSGDGDRPGRRGAAESQTWVDRYAPETQSELAVHKKKISEVEDWLTRNMQPRTQGSEQARAPVLLLTGPAGAGKTATVRVLAKQYGLEVREWTNPTTIPYDPDRVLSGQQDFRVVGGPISQSQTALFQDFLSRANRYPTLELFGSETASRKLCLVEDVPNAFHRDPQSLHTILQKFVRTSRSPLVFIVSDTFGGESGAYKLFPRTAQAALGVQNISFNPVAPTSMVKVMTRIATLESNKRRFAVPSKAALEALASASAGDIRSGLNALQFACLKDTQDLDKALVAGSAGKPAQGGPAGARWGKRRAAGGSSRAKPRSEEAEPAAIGGRDSSMFLFRALGKILYCKREVRTPDDPVLPDHLAHHNRDRLKIHPESVLEHTHLSSENFNLYLHQNYLDFYQGLDDVVEATRYFSDSDLLTCEWKSRAAMTSYSASLTARAVIHCNTARSQSSSAGGGGWRPLHKPQWFQVSRKYKDNCAGAKDLFAGHCWTPVELQTQLVPFLAKISVPLDSPGQINFLQEVTGFTQNQFSRRRPQRLDEKDGADEEEEGDQDVPVASSSQGGRAPPARPPPATSEHADPLGSRPESDSHDTVVIEDFDDWD